MDFNARSKKQLNFKALLVAGLMLTWGCGKVVGSSDTGDAGLVRGDDGGMVQPSDSGVVDPDSGGSPVDAGSVFTLADCSGNIPASDLYECFLQATCEVNKRCGTSDGAAAVFGSTEECVLAGGSLGQGGELENFLISVNNAASASNFASVNSLNYDETAARNCLSQASQATCKQNPFEISAACREIVRPAEDTENCVYDFQCSSKNYCERGTCDPTDACCEGSCREFLDDGKDCSVVGEALEGNSRACRSGKCVLETTTTGVFPRVTTTEWTCQSGIINSPCNDNDECQSDFYCNDVFARTTKGLCAEDLSEGEICGEGSLGDADLECKEGVRCVNRACAAVEQIGSRCDGACNGAFYCDPNKEVCLDLPADSEPCTDSGRVCLGADLYCSSEATPTCRSRAAVDGVCDRADGCVGGAYCNYGAGGAGTCAAQKEDSESCGGHLECKSGLCSEKSCVPATADLDCKTP